MILKETGEGSKAMLHISDSNLHSLKPADFLHSVFFITHLAVSGVGPPAALSCFSF